MLFVLISIVIMFATVIYTINSISPLPQTNPLIGLIGSIKYMYDTIMLHWMSILIVIFAMSYFIDRLYGIAAFALYWLPYAITNRQYLKDLVWKRKILIPVLIALYLFVGFAFTIGRLYLYIKFDETFSKRYVVGENSSEAMHQKIYNDHKHIIYHWLADWPFYALKYVITEFLMHIILEIMNWGEGWYIWIIRKALNA